MGPLMIWTDGSFVEQGAEESFELDCECSTERDGANDFTASLPIDIRPPANAAIYVDGTDIGGLVMERESDTRIADKLTWKCRTWQGVLADKRVVPASGQDYYTLTGTVAECISALISHVGLSALFSVGECPDESISGYQFSRQIGYCDAWDGLQDMLATKSLRPEFSVTRESGTTSVLIGAVAVRTLGEEVDGENADLTMRAALAPYNHVIGMGQGELHERDVVDFYADADGNISGTQTFTGIEERTLMYDSPSSDHDALVDGAKRLLAEAQGQGEVEVALPNSIDVALGDYVAAYDHRIGAYVTAKVTGCVIKASNGTMTREWRAGE